MTVQAFVFVETQFDNLGDALINRELISLISGHAEVTIGLSRVPSRFQEKIGYDFLSQFTLDKTRGRSRFLLKILFKALAGRSCYLFLSPGGWIGEIDGRLNLRSWFHTLLYYVLSWCGVKICQFGVSYEDLGPKLSLLLRARSRALYCHYVRDSDSENVMKSLNVKVDGICPDLALNGFEKQWPSRNPDGVTFSFRSDQYPDQIDDIKRFIELFIEHYGLDNPVYFVSQVEKDDEVNRALQTWFNKRFDAQAEVEVDCSRLETTKEFYLRSNIIISNRLHALLLGGSVGNAMIAVPIGSVNKKIVSLFNDLGLEEHIFDVVEQGQDIDSVRLGFVREHYFDGMSEKRMIGDVFDALFAKSGNHV